MRIFWLEVPEMGIPKRGYHKLLEKHHLGYTWDLSSAHVGVSNFNADIMRHVTTAFEYREKYDLPVDLGVPYFGQTQKRI
jgi:hypothetical protein